MNFLRNIFTVAVSWVKNEPVVEASILAAAGQVYAAYQHGDVTSGLITGALTAVLATIARAFVDSPATSQAKTEALAIQDSVPDYIEPTVPTEPLAPAEPTQESEPIEAAKLPDSPVVAG